MTVRGVIFSHVIVTLTALLIVMGLASFLLSEVLFVSLGLPEVAAILLGAASIALILGWVASRGFLRRLRRAAAISHVWLRGDLSQPIADPTRDDFGQLTRNLDQLTRQFAQDEQDLAELRAREAQLSEQVRAISVVEERNRLARELHDGVKQHLFSLAMTASAVQERLQTDPACVSPDLAEMIGQIKSTTQAAQHEMTQLIEGLRPISLQERGLELALRDYCLLFGAREHLLIYIDVQGNTALLPLSLAEALYVVTQEALANIARHARATRVDIKLAVIPEQATLTVRDNGTGFDPSRPRQGLGVSNMQERLLALGGRLTIESQPSRGTMVIAEVGLARPLPAPRPYSRLDENRPLPEIGNWAWLGQRLVIPVGQTWPWLPADEVHLRQPLIELAQSPLEAMARRGFLGFGRGYFVRSGSKGTVIAHLNRGFTGSEWRADGANWSFNVIHRLSGKWVLYRNGQPLAAVQYQGRQMAIWSELVYAGHGYRLSATARPGSEFALIDEDGQELLHTSSDPAFEIILLRPIPLSLLVIAILCILDERGSATMKPVSSV